MALVDLILGRPFQPSFSQSEDGLDFILLDCTTVEEFTDSLTISPYPIESGAKMADHAVKEPVHLHLEGFIAEVPIDLVAQITSPKGRAADGYRKLVELQETKEPFTAFTATRVLRGVLMEKLVVRRDATGDALGFSCDLREVTFAESETATVTLEPRKAAKKRNAGKQATSPVTGDGGLSSTAYRLIF